MYELRIKLKLKDESWEKILKLEKLVDLMIECFEDVELVSGTEVEYVNN